MVYIASPFFNMFEVAVKGNMIEEVEKVFNLEDDDLFDPEDSDASEDYGNTDSNTSPNRRFELAKTIYKENVRGISKCDTLVFPKFTTDLGTLWEVGFAMGLGKRIYRYNFLSRELEKVDYKPIEWNSVVRNSRTIGSIFDAVIFGVLSSNANLAPNLIYKFNENVEFSDNIMFAANFKFETSNGEILKPEERNWGGTIL